MFLSDRGPSIGIWHNGIFPLEPEEPRAFRSAVHSIPALSRFDAVC